MRNTCSKLKSKVGIENKIGCKLKTKKQFLNLKKWKFFNFNF